MSRYFAARGAVYILETWPGAGRKYTLSHSQAGQGGGGLLFGNTGKTSDTLGPVKSGHAIIFTGYQMRETEIVAKAACLNDHRVMYTFGKGFGDISINGEALLGNPQSSVAFEKDLQSFYDKHRVGNAKGDNLQLSIRNGGVIEFYLVGMTIMGYDATLEIMPFTLTGVLKK